MTWILLVTWITPGQPTTSYQKQFSSQQTCAAARDEVLKSALALRQQMFADAGGNQNLQIVVSMKYPYASAVCSAQ
jgi:hypothetical protein